MGFFRGRRARIPPDQALYGGATAPQAVTMPFGEEFRVFVTAAFSPGNPPGLMETLASVPLSGDVSVAAFVVAQTLFLLLEKKDERGFLDALYVGLPLLMRWPREG